MHLDRRRLVDPHHAVVIEIILLDRALLIGEPAVERAGPAEDETALDLRFDRVGVDDKTAIDRGHRSSHHHRALRQDLDLDHHADMAAEDRADGDAAPNARRARRVPGRLLGNKVEQRQNAWVLLQQGPAISDRVLAGGVGQLVNKALDLEQVVRGSDTAPPADGQVLRHLERNPLGFQVGKIVGRIVGAFRRVRIKAICANRLGRPAAEYGRTRHPVGPGDGHPVSVYDCGDMVVIGRSRDVVLNILFARPNHLHRIVDSFGDPDRQPHRIFLQPSAKAAAKVLVMNDDLVGGQPGDLCRDGLGTHRNLCPHPDIAGIRAHMRHRIQRLHRRVGQHRQLVDRLNRLARLLHVADLPREDGLSAAGGLLQLGKETGG